MKILTTILCIIAISACTNEKDTRNALSSNDYTNIKIVGYSLFGCSEDDFYHTEFTAKTKSGKKVNGVVCSGLFFKGATVRF